MEKKIQKMEWLSILCNRNTTKITYSSLSISSMGKTISGMEYRTGEEGKGRDATFTVAITAPSGALNGTRDWTTSLGHSGGTLKTGINGSWGAMGEGAETGGRSSSDPGRQTTWTVTGTWSVKGSIGPDETPVTVRE